MKCAKCNYRNADALAMGRNEGLCVTCQGDPIRRDSDGMWECRDCGAFHGEEESARKCRKADLEERVLGPARMAAWRCSST